MLKILIADDDLIARLLLSEYLAEFGNCDSVVDGKEAVRAYRLAAQREKPYDLVCLDIMMPDVDGIEALTQIRQFEKKQNIPSAQQVPIVMVTALVDELSRKTAHNAQCNAYITKPVDHNELVKTLKELNVI